MKCINKKILKLLLIACIFVMLSALTGCGNEEEAVVTNYEVNHYDKTMDVADLYAADLCVTSGDTAMDGVEVDNSLHGAALFSPTDSNTLYAFQANQQLEPASTTKIMTALLALERGNLDDIVTVSEHAVNDLEEGSSVCNLSPGDQITLRDLLYGLMLESGNDAAVAIAEFVGGDEATFVSMMNQKAHDLGATHTNFMNPHGLHDDNHYTTAYDLYLMFNECLKDETFIQIIQAPSYNTSITKADGTMVSVTWTPTNHYASGDATPPDGITVIGGKTGTTDQAGSCLVLYSQNKSGTPFISIVMGGTTKDTLYSNMNILLQAEAQK